MDIKTRNFGVVTVQQDAVYSFPAGVYGFEDCHEFAIFQHDLDDELSLLYLHNTQGDFPCFLVFEPWDLFKGYAPKLSPEDLEACGVTSEDDLIFLSIAKLPAVATDLSLNLKSPVVLNPRTKEARQVILTNPDYEVRYYPFHSGRKESK